MTSLFNICGRENIKDEIVPHLEPRRLPSTVDPDAIQTDIGKRASQRPVRISAWKLAKLDSNEAIKAGAKARASSSVLRPLSSRPHHNDGDHLSSTTMSGASSQTSARQGYYESNSRPGTSRLSTTKSSYPPSQASRDDIDTCAHSISNLSSPLAANVIPSPLGQHSSNIEHFNPIYQSSAMQSPLSVRANDVNIPAGDSVARVPMRTTIRALQKTQNPQYSGIQKLACLSRLPPGVSVLPPRFLQKSSHTRASQFSLEARL